MIDEIDEAVEDIVEQVKGFELSKNSMRKWTIPRFMKRFTGNSTFR